MREYLTQRMLPKLLDKSGEMLLQQIVTMWMNYRNVFVTFCAKLFSYLDRFYVQIASKRTLREEGHFIFKETIFNVLKEQLRDTVLQKIREDRDGKAVNRSLLRNTILVSCLS